MFLLCFRCRQKCVSSPVLISLVSLLRTLTSPYSFLQFDQIQVRETELPELKQLMDEIIPCQVKVSCDVHKFGVQVDASVLFNLASTTLTSLSLSVSGRNRYEPGKGQHPLASLHLESLHRGLRSRFGYRFRSAGSFSFLLYTSIDI